MSEHQYNHIEGLGVDIKIWNRGVPVEEQAVEQLRNLSSMPFIYRHIAAMSDCHWGRGATVGSVIATKGAIIPAAVGVMNWSRSPIRSSKWFA